MVFSSPSHSYWLILWLVHNIGLTLLNKVAFSKVDFPYPFLLSAIHMLCNWIGSFWCFWMLERHELFHAKQSPRHSNSDEEEQLLLESNYQEQEIDSGEPETKEKHHWLARILGDSIVRRKTLDADAYRSILGFSIIFSLNIAVGNVSLKFVSVNFNQIMRSLVPALTIAMSYAVGKSVSRKRRNAVIPIILGVRRSCACLSFSATRNIGGHGVLRRHFIYGSWFLYHIIVYHFGGTQSCSKWRNFDWPNEASSG